MSFSILLDKTYKKTNLRSLYDELRNKITSTTFPIYCDFIKSDLRFLTVVGLEPVSNPDVFKVWYVDQGSIDFVELHGFVAVERYIFYSHLDKSL